MTHRSTPSIRVLLLGIVFDRVGAAGAAGIEVFIKFGRDRLSPLLGLLGVLIAEGK